MISYPAYAGDGRAEATIGLNAIGLLSPIALLERLTLAPVTLVLRFARNVTSFDRDQGLPFYRT